jgi:hypothetical protein
LSLRKTQVTKISKKAKLLIISKVMKKKLEADLISIAHRILQLKNKSDVNQLFLETQKLYEKLAVLRFVEEHFGEPKPTIGQAEVVEKMKEFFETIKVPELNIKPKNNEAVVEEAVESIEEPIDKIESISTEDIDPVISKIEGVETEKEVAININETSEPIEIESAPIMEAVELENTFEITAEAKEEINKTSEPLEVESAPIIEAVELENTIEIKAESKEEIKTSPILEEIKLVKQEAPKKSEAVQISFEDLLGGKYTEPNFVKATSIEKNSEIKTIESILPFDFQKETASNAQQVEKEEPKTITLNDKLTKGITIGLNDRIAFVKHLFGGNNEDYNRVLNQLITYDNFQDTKSFIDEMVKPDYNNWDGKEDYEHRFMEIIEKKFLSF